MSAKRIAIFTTTRAEFGAFKPLIEEIKKSRSLSHLLFVGGAHLRLEYGNTVADIQAQGYEITDFFDYLDADNSFFGLTSSVGVESKIMATLFNKYDFDLVCVAGDRYELIPVALAAILFRKPILHLYGGEITEGVIDDQVRHMLTKASHLHFTSCDLHSENVRRMGEESWRVFTTGELVVDVMANSERLTKDNIFQQFNFDVNKPTILLSYHPIADNSKISAAEQIENIFLALKEFDLQVMVTAPNVEVGSAEIMNVIERYVEENANYRFIASLGYLRYYSFLECAEFIIGNSSSGILEAPFFKIPTINVGPRQQGRIRHASVIDTDNSINQIIFGIERAIESSFRKNLLEMDFKLGDGFAAKKMVDILEKISLDESLLQKKLIFN